MGAESSSFCRNFIKNVFHKLKSWLDTEFKSSFAYSNLSLNLSMPLVNHSKNKNKNRKEGNTTDALNI